MRFYFIILLFLTACSGTKIISYPHAGARFDQYRTFKLESHEKLAEISPRGYATYERWGELIATEMEARGYRYHLSADLLVEYQVSSGLGNAANRSSYYDPYYYGYYPSVEYGNTQSVELLIEVVLKDLKNQKTAWTGTADLTLRGKSQERAQKIESAIQEIFTRFTFKAAKQ